MEINIIHLYPDLLNLYGDKGNIASLSFRCLWRGIEVNVKEFSDDEDFNLENCDILYLGGGGTHEQEIVLEKLMPYKSLILEYVQKGGTVFATCGGFQMLGSLGILDIKVKTAKKRASGNVVAECVLDGLKVLVSGFENHTNVTDIGDLTPLGSVLKGYGNNGAGFEGAIYKNVIATNLHGPILPKNPALSDFILKKALDGKYPSVQLKPLCDNFENITSKNIIKEVLEEYK